MELDVAMCDELLATTRAVRKRLDLTREVPRDVIVFRAGRRQTPIRLN